MTDLPAPLTPPECDVSGLQWMPLHGGKMLRSKFWSLARRNPKAGLVGIRLWWQAFIQVPAASLPSDDDQLADLAGFGEDLKTWRTVKDIALHGFILCSDNRLYHPTVAEEALIAYEMSLGRQKRNEAGAKRLRDWREKKKAEAEAKKRENGGGGGNGNGGEAENETPHETPPETRFKLVTKRAGNANNSTLQDTTLPIPTSSARASRAPGGKSKLFTEGVLAVQRLTNRSELASRSLIGAWLGKLAESAEALLDVIGEAEQLCPADAAAWIDAAVQARSGTRKSAAQRSSDEAMAAQMRRIADLEREESQQQGVMIQ